MNILVCLKRVPDSTTKISIRDGNSMDPQGVEYVISPYDELAIELALRLKDKHGGETIGVSVDPDGNETVMRKALAMGLDKGVILQANTGFDGAATASVLAAGLKDIPHNIILFGKQAIDDDSCQVPTLVAHKLGVPRVNVCVGLEIEGERAMCRRQIEGGEEILEIALPAVISVQKGINEIHEPRYPSLKGIMAAKKKPIEKKEVTTAEAVQDILKMELPPERPEGKIVGEGAAAAAELVRLLREEAKVI